MFELLCFSTLTFSLGFLTAIIIFGFKKAPKSNSVKLPAIIGAVNGETFYCLQLDSEKAIISKTKNLSDALQYPALNRTHSIPIEQFSKMKLGDELRSEVEIKLETLKAKKQLEQEGFLSVAK